MSDLVFLSQTEKAAEPQPLHSQLNGFAVIKCSCGDAEPLVIGTLDGTVKCVACGERYMIASASFAVDPLSRQVSVHMQIGRLSNLSRPARRM